MESQLKCPACEKEFTESNPPRLLAACGHSFCENCLKDKVEEKDGKFIITCPEDNEQIVLKTNDVSTLPKNKALMKIIESKKANSSFKDPELEMSKITKTEDMQQEDEEARQIVQAMALSKSVGQISEQKPSSEKQEQTKIYTQQIQVESTTKQAQNKEEKAEQKSKNYQQQKCKAHQKPLEVVCIIDMKRICVNCAIFGEHKGHQFKSLEQIENERTAYYSSILEIIQKKHTIADRLSNQQTCSSIMEILQKKKSTMKNTITDKFKKLTETIQLKKKESLKTLDALVQKNQAKLKNLMKIDNLTLQKYDGWEQKSYEQIKILEGDNFQAKLHLIFSQTGEDADILDEGDLIINQMSKQEENLANQVEILLENIGVDFNLDIFNYIEGFVDIFDEPKKKKAKNRASKVESIPSAPQIPIPRTTLSQKKEENIPEIKQRTKNTPIVTQPDFPKVQILMPINKTTKQHHLHMQESLLQLEEEFSHNRPEFVKTEQIHIIPDPEIIPQSPLRRDKNVVSPSSKLTMKNNSGLINGSMSPRASNVNKKDDSFTQQKIERPNKKRLSKLKFPQKIQKIVESLVNDQTQLVDLTNAQLGGSTIAIIAQFLAGSKVKTVKFIRNSITDDTVAKIIPYLKGIITLNLSQNQLTERTLDILIENRSSLESIKSVILSQNKINERKAKLKIDKLKSLDVVVSI